VHAWFKQSGDGVAETNDALLAFVTSLVYVVELRHLAVQLELLEK
jgi:hypothetical protein